MVFEILPEPYTKPGRAISKPVPQALIIHITGPEYLCRDMDIPSQNPYFS